MKPPSNEGQSSDYLPIAGPASGLGRGLRLFAALICGAGLVLALPPYSLWPLAPILIGTLYMLLRGCKTPRSAFWTGWIAGAGFFAFGLFWIAEAFLVEAELFAWMIPIAIPALAFGLGLFWAFGFWAAARLIARGFNPVLSFALCWMLGELARATILTGFPWNQPGYVWVDTPVVQNAAYLGIQGITQLTLLCGALLGAGLCAATSRGRIVQPLLALAIIAVGWVSGMERLGRDAPAASAAQPVVGIVQPSIAQQDKWRPDLREVHLRDLMEQTQRLSAQGATIIVWPEAATSFALTELPELREAIGAMLSPQGVLLTGAVRIEGRATPQQKIYNSLLAIGPDGSLIDSYDKQHLVPFGEYVPLGDMLSTVGIRELINIPGGFTAGDTSHRREMSIPGAPPLNPMICYETIFPGEVMGRGSKAGWMVQITNDAWFGTSAGPYQHLAQARVRAIERGMPLIRSANTGVSAIIDSQGRLISAMGINQRGVIMATLPTAFSSTLYHKTEIGGLLTLMAFIALILVFFRKPNTQR